MKETNIETNNHSFTIKERGNKTMQEHGRYIELRTSDGKPICSFYLFEREIGSDMVEKKPDAASTQHHTPKNGTGNGQGNGQSKVQTDLPPQSSRQTQSQPNQQSMMTDSQKRLLFRLLADQGLEGDKAHEHLKKQFQVTTLKEVTKHEASREIEKLLETAKGGRPFHAAA